MIRLYRYCAMRNGQMVSLPELGRIRELFAHDDLFIIAQDIFPTETTDIADVVLPAAMWSEKTGTFTNVDRTCHLSEKAVEPPGEARTDFDIFLDYSQRMEFKDKDKQPLLQWTCPEDAFNAWCKCSENTPLCDYSGMSYAKLKGGSGIQCMCTHRVYVCG